ncbi:GerMN domain-containing protein [Actinoplanes solisilvae]|uniref:GerMN domain-containing protein n=1 Tax=Actinoplanes solisilvae TaxID=2486853 RepID=UPI000FDAF000|nr:GerMN domain-containing protein [Actinoplanes solisilvae]
MRGVVFPAAIVLTLLLAACGVPSQDNPHVVELPRRPLTSPDGSAVATDPDGEVAHVLCLVRGDRLAQTVRRARTYPSVQQQLDDLVAGPTPAESSAGLSTALAGLTVAAGAAQNGQVTVETAEQDEGSARNNEILAYGQMVCTLTGRADVATVSFTRDGQRLEVPRADGTLSDELLHAGDYAGLLGPA